MYNQIRIQPHIQNIRPGLNETETKEYLRISESWKDNDIRIYFFLYIHQKEIISHLKATRNLPNTVTNIIRDFKHFLHHHYMVEFETDNFNVHTSLPDERTMYTRDYIVVPLGTEFFIPVDSEILKLLSAFDTLDGTPELTTLSSKDLGIIGDVMRAVSPHTIVPSGKVITLQPSKVVVNPTQGIITYHGSLLNANEIKLLNKIGTLKVIEVSDVEKL